MADKTSWTKPLARMMYGDSIVASEWLEVGAVSEHADASEPRTVDSRGTDGSDGVTQRCAGVLG